jgi:hypothetical protein
MYFFLNFWKERFCSHMYDMNIGCGCEFCFDIKDQCIRLNTLMNLLHNFIFGTLTIEMLKKYDGQESGNQKN